MADQRDITSVYFLGAGGIGMSAIARYYLQRGLFVAGYDRVSTPLTDQLVAEGAHLHFTADTAMIPTACLDKDTCLVVYTPAIAADHCELQYFRERGYRVVKRAEVLGMITRELRALCVAGTHGKTTTSAICANILYSSHLGCNAFLGGITKNFGTNYLLSTTSDYVVVEADEYDRSFHHLTPYITVVTSADADHLDIYGTAEAYRESFSHYTSLVRGDGAVIVHTDVLDILPLRCPETTRVYSYSRHKGEFYAENIRVTDSAILFDFCSPIECVRDIALRQRVMVNVDNSVAAMAMSQLCGATAAELRRGVETFSGVARRFEVRVDTGCRTLVSDYAHHPKEIVQSVQSLRTLFPGRRLTVIFQPHLYSRTKDFYREFAAALGGFDEVLLCEIYPAREEPIPGVTSQLIYDALPAGLTKTMIASTEIVHEVSARSFDVLVILGAGDIDKYMSDIETIIKGE